MSDAAGCYLGYIAMLLDEEREHHVFFCEKAWRKLTHTQHFSQNNDMHACKASAGWTMQ